jgi:hydrogenase maturation protease
MSAPFHLVEPIADAVMYEGYVLYPYRASAMKNRFRWQFGVLAPRCHGEAGGEAWYAQTECLVEPGAHARLRVRVRALQVQRRTIEEPVEDGGWRACDRLSLEDRELLTWDEAVAAALTSEPLPLDCLRTHEHTMRLELAPCIECDVVRRRDGSDAARIVRQRWPVSAVVRIRSKQVGELMQVRVRVENASRNETAPAHDARAEALRHSLLGCHTLLHIEDGCFVSSIDPPPQFAAAARSCRNEHTWPVLAGPAGARDLMLSAPIILYDYPAIAPESRDSFYDATEIEEMLALRVMTMPPREQREAAATDDRAAAIVQRTSGISDVRLHGAVRSFEELDAAVPSPERDSVEVDGVRVARGSRVRLEPLQRADSMDMFLRGRVATVAAVFRDLDDRVYLAVTIDGDPGADLQASHGRFFYFLPEEVRPCPLANGTLVADPPRVLVAGLGNIFLGDDAFGVEVVKRLATAHLPADVRVLDVGTRSLHLAYELRERAYETVILIDVVSRGGAPGTLYLLEPEHHADATACSASDGHGVRPHDLVALVRRLGGDVNRMRIVACEPSRLGPDAGLSAAVESAVDEAVQLVCRLIAPAACAEARA